MLEATRNKKHFGTNTQTNEGRAARQLRVLRVGPVFAASLALVSVPHLRRECDERVAAEKKHRHRLLARRRGELNTTQHRDNRGMASSVATLDMRAHEWPGRAHALEELDDVCSKCCSDVGVELHPS